MTKVRRPRALMSSRPDLTSRIQYLRSTGPRQRQRDVAVCFGLLQTIDSREGSESLMTNLKPVDVAIIGGGWTRLLTANEITAKTSLAVAALEPGRPRKFTDYPVTMDVLDYNIHLRMMPNTAEETIPHRHSPKDKP